MLTPPSVSLYNAICSIVMISCVGCIGSNFFSCSVGFHGLHGILLTSYFQFVMIYTYSIDNICGFQEAKYIVF
jgi:hypothetical protein